MNDRTTTSTNAASLAATFLDKTDAHHALDELHDAGYRQVWLGVTHGTAQTGGVTVDDANASTGGPMGAIGKFFSGDESSAMSLHDALVAHGIAHELAATIEGKLAEHSAVITVGAENDAHEAIEIIEANGGTVITATSARAGVVPPVAAATIDEDRRLQLRAERLTIDKDRVAAGEARIRKDVVSENQAVDVPVYHEELFIQRHPVSGDVAATTPIGDGTEIRIPLSEERVDVTKNTVVTEEVAIGKRQVAGVQRVDETVRHEELVVDDDSSHGARKS